MDTLGGSRGDVTSTAATEQLAVGGDPTSIYRFPVQRKKTI